VHYHPPMSKKVPLTTLATGKYVRLVKQGRWEFAQRTKASGIVMIIPLTDAGELLFIEQPRAAIGKNVIEFPAGLAGDGEGTVRESLATAAKRELLEETGYKARSMRPLTEGPPSAGISDEIITLFLATGLKKVSDATGDGHEQITTHLVPLVSAQAWLKRRAKRKNTMIDLKLWGGLYFAEQAATSPCGRPDANHLY